MIKPRQILLSKRANIFYLEHARVLQKNDRVVYLTDRGEDVESFFNIPERNTALILLGKGCSITDAAVRKLAESNVVVGFSGSGGTPLVGAVDIVFLTGASEYRPTEYMQAWAKKWFDEPTRVEMAKDLLLCRVDVVKVAWRAFSLPESIEETFRAEIARRTTTQDLLLAEAIWSKQLYRALAGSIGLTKFSRDAGAMAGAEGSSAVADRINSFLDHGNYLAYGLAAVALNGLGISYAFPLLHGKTRRGALVFDLADVIKDAFVMPLAFSCGAEPKIKDRDFRASLIKCFHEREALDLMFDLAKTIALKNPL